MKKSLSLLVFSFALLNAGSVYVNGYVKSDGTYVAPHYRSSPDSSTYNNWTTKGNVNPYTGAEGTKEPTPNYNYGSSGTNYNNYGSSGLKGYNK
jgi:hypothetical protein